MVARCIENKVDNPSYTLDKSYRVNEEGLANNFWYSGPIIDTWNGQFSTGPQPKLKEGVVFKRNGCKFIIEKEEGE